MGLPVFLVDSMKPLFKTRHISGTIIVYPRACTASVVQGLKLTHVLLLPDQHIVTIPDLQS